MDMLSANVQAYMVLNDNAVMQETGEDVPIYSNCTPRSLGRNKSQISNATLVEAWKAIRGGGTEKTFSDLTSKDDDTRQAATAEYNRILTKIAQDAGVATYQRARAHALYAFKQACKAVISEARVIICTNNTCGDPLVAPNFGENATGILVIRDEDPKEMEASTWIPLTKLEASRRTSGVIIIGDEKQLTPTVLANQGEKRYNEFGDQNEMPFMTRLLRMKYPSIALTEQFRYREEFVPWLNHRTYANKLNSHPSTRKIRVYANYAKALMTVIGLDHKSKLDMGNIVVSIENSTCQIESGLMSRYNNEHRHFVLDLLIENQMCRGYKGLEIKIVVPYIAQAGKEAELIILDWVISESGSYKDLGFTTNDNCGNVAMTRMRQAMLVLLPESCGPVDRDVNDIQVNETLLAKLSPAKSTADPNEDNTGAGILSADAIVDPDNTAGEGTWTVDASADEVDYTADGGWGSAGNVDNGGQSSGW
ncbi:hypothetical protein BJX64DRAFT_287049 [Aspergillus heterothallicus]